MRDQAQEVASGALEGRVLLREKIDELGKRIVKGREDATSEQV